MQQPIFHARPGHFDPFGQHKTALKLPTGDTSMQVDTPVIFFGLPPADDQLPVLYGDRQVVLGKARHRQRDPIRSLVGLFYVERRIAVIVGLCSPLHQPFQLLEPQQVGMRAQSHLRHRHVLHQATVLRPRIRRPF